jgi:small conductance mechanosensitive channel
VEFVTVLPLTAPVPSPSPSGIVDETAQAVVSFWDSFWAWFLGWPVRVLIVRAVGLIVLAVVRRVIAHATDRIARGYHRAYLAADEATETERRRRKAFVQETLGLVTPEVKQRRAQRARTVGSVLTSAATIIIVTAMALLILDAVGASRVVQYLWGMAGVLAVAVGFGAQSLVRDFLSGLFILSEDQFGVGDEVDLGAGAAGVVEKVDLRLTHVRSFDGTLWHVRSGAILRAGNHTQQWARAVAEIKVPIGSDVDVVRAALGRAADAVRGDDTLAADLLEAPSVRGVDSISEGAYAFTLHARVRPGTDGDMKRALLVAAYAELRVAGIIVTSAAPEE